MLVASALLVIASLLAPAPSRAADAKADLGAERRAQADRVVALADQARDARLGAMALRLYEEALGLAPDQPAARTALGWTRAGAGWRPPANAIPGDGWADDGEPDLARLEKKEASLRQEYVKSLVAAAAAAKA